MVGPGRGAVRGSLAQSFVVGLQGTEARPEELELAGPVGLGGVILFARNVESPLQVWELNYSLRRAAAAAERPALWVMVDQEGGSVARLGEPFTHGPDMAEMGRREGPEGLWAHGRRMGRELAAAGFNWNLAPVLDVHAREDGVMARRSLGGDAHRVAELGEAYIRGLQEGGCLACAKHFPGLGRTTADTHKSRPRVDLTLADLEEMELVPFRRAASAGVDGIMVCHAVFPALDPDRPASLSPAVMEMIREDLSYRGLIVTDDLEMGAVTADLSPDEAAVAAWRAGADIILVCHRPELAVRALDRLTDLVISGEIPFSEVWRRQQRIVELKRFIAALPPDSGQLREIFFA